MKSPADPPETPPGPFQGSVSLSLCQLGLTQTIGGTWQLAAVYSRIAPGFSGLQSDRAAVRRGTVSEMELMTAGPFSEEGSGPSCLRGR